MSTTIPLSNQSIAVDQDADHDELVDAVMQLVEENRELRQEVADLREENRRLRDDVEIPSRGDNDQDARLDAFSTGLSTAHEGIEAVETEAEASELTASDDETALRRDELTPIERLSTDGDVEDVTTSASVERAVEIFDNIQSVTRRC
jgi:seryl-tRNA synthetase